MNFLRWIDKAIARAECRLIVLFLSLMVSLTFFQVILRALYTHGRFQWANDLLSRIDWAEPLVRLLVLWITFLGASLLTREGKHIKIDLLFFLPVRWRPVRGLILSSGCVLICAFMLKASIDHIRMEMGFGGELFLGLPVWAGQLIIPAGFAVILFRFVLRAIEELLELSTILKDSRTDGA